ncbi:hypothetical protein [Peribacillus asahii]|uniref:hypothetical protein n=1 Tax=Peribacillus asahii TaxID=228899 RepID=UPI0038220B2E
MTTRYLGDGIWARRSSIENAEIMMPVDIQNHHSESIQVHNNTVVANATYADSSTWLPCEGFDKIAVTFKNSGSTASVIYAIFSQDGVNMEGQISILPSATDQHRAGEVPVCAPYFKIRVHNGHTAPVTVSATATLKA